MVSKVGMRADPMGMSRGHMIRRVTCLMNMQHGRLLQGKQQRRTQRDPDQDSQQALILVDGFEQ
jgi:hypothetical protein